MIMDELKTLLRQAFYKHFSIERKRDNLYQVFLPLFYPDGDMIDIFIQTTSSRNLILCDCSMTLMHLSYTMDVDSIGQKGKFKEILAECGVSCRDGNIVLETSPENIFTSIMQFSQALERVYALRVLKKPSNNNKFYEQLNDYVINKLSIYNPQVNYTPIESEKDMIVDYRLNVGNKNIFLYGIQGNDKALNSLISILSFINKGISFTSIAVYDNYAKLPMQTQKKVMNITDKQFSDFDSFIKDDGNYIHRVA